MLGAFLSGLVGGLLYCLPVSAVNVEIIRRGLANGFATSLLVSLGAIAGDAVWLALAVLGAEAMLRVWILRLVLGVVGAVVLLVLARSAWRSAQREPALGPLPPVGAMRALGLGALLCLASPFAVLVLLSVIGSIGAPYAGGGPATRAALYVGILGGAVVYGFVAAGLSSWGQRLVTRDTLRHVDRVAAVLFAGLAALLAWQTAVR